MAKDNNYPTSDVPPVEPVGATGGDQPAEDPLVELARIVNRNRQPGAGVGGDRVGQTDYFAGLEDLGEPAAPSVAGNDRSGDRVEPTFDYGTPAQDDLAHAAQTVAEVSPLSAQQTDVGYAPQPDINVHFDAHDANANPAFDVDVPSADDLGLDIPESTLESGVALDLENSLTAELEDELIGALRQNFDSPVAMPHEAAVVASAPHVAAEASFTEPVIGDTLSREPPADYHFVETPAPDVAPVAPAEAYSAEVHVEPAQTSYENLSAQNSFALDEAALAAEVAAVPETMAENVESADALTARSLDETPLRTSPISEDDLFAELGAVATVGVPAEADSAAADPFDNLFADLQPPSQMAAAAEPAADDIDDMAWPAAAAAVPAYVSEDETPPPPEGYDLDAVAKAMQESDPTLGSAGVLPPHTKAEKAAAPQQEASRKGIYAAAAVLAVAVLGGGVFMFMDGSAVTVPDGPPPVIAGLEGPLKVYPDAQPETESQTSKLIYDRVGNGEDTSRERLVLPENTRPAELPPAPAGVATADPLVPGAPKKVRTLVVRPDGTIVSAPDTPAPRTVSTTPVTTTTPVATTQPDVTTPVAAVPAPGAVTQPAPAGAATDINTPGPGTPAIVATPDDTSLPVQPANIPTILPKKKPAAPVQVASAPQATTQSGPLDLNSSSVQPAPVAAAPQAAAPAVTTSSGSIPAGTYVVQVTSQRSETAARDAYSSLQQRYPSILGSQSAVIVSAAIQDRGTFYRARIPMGSRNEALSLCESLQAAGGDCFVRRN
ncbi:SPOR domain-containing protein [Labrenzia sp. CE80]|uniref:SPOR domain-containing protein n=1 Tax=Labrenzia sp. CE80 TaxID=1788986 RepID=UPI00129A39E0|nr:SPOR domain-containing protein [Labrenzia sp. CE80]